MNNPDNIDKRSPAYRIHRVSAFEDSLLMYVIVVIDIQPNDVTAVGHQIDGPFVAQAEHTVNNLVLNVLDGTNVGTFIHQRFDLFFGNRTFGGFYVQQPDNRLCGGT